MARHNPADPFVLPARVPGPQNEHALADVVSDYLHSCRAELWWLKVHGGSYQRAGVVDYLICLGGLFIAIELKHPVDPELPTMGQARELAWVARAGGITGVCHSLAEVRSVLDHARRQVALRPV